MFQIVYQLHLEAAAGGTPRCTISGAGRWRCSGQASAGSGCAPRPLIARVAEPRRDLHLPADNDTARLARRIGRGCGRCACVTAGTAQLVAAPAEGGEGGILGVARRVGRKGSLLPGEYAQEIYAACDVPRLGCSHLVCDRGRRWTRSGRWSACPRRRRRLGVQRVSSSDEQGCCCRHAATATAASISRGRARAGPLCIDLSSQATHQRAIEGARGSVRIRSRWRRGCRCCCRCWCRVPLGRRRWARNARTPCRARLSSRPTWRPVSRSTSSTTQPGAASRWRRCSGSIRCSSTGEASGA